MYETVSEYASPLSNSDDILVSIHVNLLENVIHDLSSPFLAR